MKSLINIRVLQHDTNDQIRIGMAYPIIDLDKAEKDIVDNYEKKTAWCGGFKAACEKYYQRIAIVRADTLEVIRPIYPINNYSPMNEYTYIIFDHKGKRLGKIEFGKRISVPSASEIEEAIKDGFPNGATYKLIVPINVCISQ